MIFLKNDFYFNYCFVYRFLLIQKWNFFYNTNQIPIVKNLLIFFNVFNLIDLDDVRSFNYSYLFRFFFGKKCCFTKPIMKFHLGVNYYKFKVFSFFYRLESFFALSVFVNDILSLSSDNYFYSIMPVNSNFFIFFFNDLNVFVEKKTNIGFYNVKDPLGFKIFFSSPFFFSCNLFLQCLKIINKNFNYSFSLIMSNKKNLWYKN